MASTHETVAILRDLIEANREMTEAYRTAADRVADGDLRLLLRRNAEERQAFLGELEAEVRRLGEDPRPMRTLGESLEHGWAKVRDALASDDPASVIAHCEQGEDEAVKAFERAVAGPLPEPIREIVERQSLGIRRAHDELRALERRAS